MSDGSLRVVGGTAAAVSQTAPSMSKALAKWLDQNAQLHRGNLDKSLNSQEPLDEIIADLAADYDRCAQAGLAFRVLQGFRLLQILSLDEQSFERVIAERDTPRSVASRDMDVCRLFNQLGELSLLKRAEALGLARIRELKPHIGLDGIRALIEGEEVDTLRYETAVAMSKRDVVEWRKQRMLVLSARLRETLDSPDAPATVPAIEPAPVIVARDELLGGAIRARIELERARAVVAPLLQCCDDDFEQARIETVHAARQIIEAIHQEADALDAMLEARFSASKAFPSDGPDRVRCNAMIESAEASAAQEADASLLARARARAGAMRWRGAPPRNVEAVIAQARRLAESEDDA